MSKKFKAPVIRTPMGTFAFAYIREPDSGNNTFSDDKYKTWHVMDDGKEVQEWSEKFVKMCHEAARAKWGKIPEDLIIPLVNGTEYAESDPEKAEAREEFKDTIIVRPKTQFKPAVFDADRTELPDDVLVKSGDRGKLSIALVPYESTEKIREGKKLVTVTSFGISPQLRAVQLLQKGGYDASNDFDDEDGYTFDGEASTPATNTGSTSGQATENANYDDI